MREPLRHFNSIKVRLERERNVKRIAESQQFQFHKGTIRTGEYAPGITFYGSISIP